MAAFHTVTCYINPTQSLRPFSGPASPPPSPLLAHTYALTCIYTALMRGYAAWHINDRAMYDLATFTFAGVLVSCFKTMSKGTC
jgi:hypothetical protein